MVKLVIVESPAKCSKIQSFLGDGYIVKATMGHIRALDETLDAVGIDKDWTPSYVELGTKKDAISKLRSAAKGADEVILASDDDREGEGIAWHVCFILRLDPATTRRIVFHEITKPAILAAVANPRRLDLNKVNAQQARAMLDLLVGFTISRVLWNRVAPKISAGRCQTPALRLVVERDNEIESHTSSASWRLSGVLVNGTAQLPFDAVDDVATEAEAREVLEKVRGNTTVIVKSVKESVSTSNAPKPLITSTLQQEASSSHGLNPKVTMQAAQKLYEAGHITYMRTDNAILSGEAAMAIRAEITKLHGTAYLGPEGQHTATAAAAAPAKKTKKAATTTATAAPAAQAAHEAIRPTHPENATVAVDDHAQQVVYKLIWRRAFQCQMAAALTDVRKAQLELKADPGRVWSAEQTKLQFAGWRILENSDDDRTAAANAAWETWKSVLVAGKTLTWKSLAADQVFTKPRGRYTEASLIAELEKRGIGRPSTFASLVSTIVDREYVEKTNVEGKSQDSKHLTIGPNQWPPTEKTTTHKVGAEKNKLRATALGRSVSDFLNREYNDLFNYEFTATMEQQLDAIAQGTTPWKSLLQTTWDKYKERYAAQSTGGAASRAARERELAPGLKVIISRKGPLFVRESATTESATPAKGKAKAKPKATFAPLPVDVTFETATADQADAAFAAAAEAFAGELLGTQDGHEIRKKKGPYGYYADWNGTRVPLKGGETLEQVIEKLTAKATANASGEAAFEKKIGDFTIRRGPYGLYFYKHTLKRVTFLKFPAGLDPEKINAADMNGLYSAGLNAKRKGFASKKPADKPTAEKIEK